MPQKPKIMEKLHLCDFSTLSISTGKLWKTFLRKLSQTRRWYCASFRTPSAKQSKPGIPKMLTADTSCDFNFFITTVQPKRWDNVKKWKSTVIFVQTVMATKLMAFGHMYYMESRYPFCQGPRKNLPVYSKLHQPALHL